MNNVFKIVSKMMEENVLLINKIIFLDIDGVLNHIGAKEKICGCIGILDSKLKLLKEIIDKTNATVILTSTWKMDWNKNVSYEEHNKYGQYMIDKFCSFQIEIYDKTSDENISERGKGIIEYLRAHKLEQVPFIIIDDEEYDYKKLKLTDKLIKTSFYTESGGLNKKHVEKAIAILNKEA